MRYIKTYEGLFDFNFINRYKIKIILKRYGITNYTIDNDGLVNVDDDVNLWNKGLTKIPIKFGRVTGGFNCGNNQLTSLEGAPKEVGGFFSCRNNYLTSLEGAPVRVADTFTCRGNELTSLEGSPKEVVGGFYCGDNKLTSLEGAPKQVGGNFYCNNNKLKSFECAPKHIGEDFNCDNNPIYEIWNLFGDYSKIDLLNDYDALQDGVVILDRLNDFLMTIGKDPVTSVKDWKCI